MIQNTAEIIKTNKAETVDLKETLSRARTEVSQIELGATEAEQEAQSLELELMQAQQAHERKEEAERKGKETKEKITEMSG